MADELVIVPEFTAVMEHRKASSSCHGAKLDLPVPPADGQEPDWYCRACGQPCERVMGDPVEVTAHG